MILDPRPARPMTSREIAKLISGILGSLVQGGTTVDAVLAALDHFHEHREGYEEALTTLRATLPVSRSN